MSELEHSGGRVKVTGDFFDESGRLSVNYRIETLTETAARVHEAGGRITMHAIIPDSIQRAIDAGFDGIEHGRSSRAVKSSRWRRPGSLGRQRHS